MSRFLVTGGAGFIGTHLVRALLGEGHDVRVLDDLSSGKAATLPPGTELVIGSVTDEALVGQALEGCDGCFHLAAIASVERCARDWAISHSVNLTGLIRVFEAARPTPARRAVPVIYVSSAAVYGDNPAVPLDETSALSPISAYGADKLGCELHARVAHLAYGIPSIGFRPFNVYGPGQDAGSPYSGVISIFAERLRSGRDLTVFGDGGQTRDFVAVADVVECLKRGMHGVRNAAEILVIATGRQVSLLELVEALSSLLRVEPSIMFAPARAGDIRHSVGNPERLLARLGTRPATSLADGLHALLEK